MKKKSLVLLCLFLLLSFAGCGPLTGTGSSSPQLRSSTGRQTPTATTTPTAIPTLYSSTKDGLYGFDASTGKMLWHNSDIVPADQPGQPLINGNTVYVQENNALYAFNMRNGKLLWQFAYEQYLPNQGDVTFLIGQKAIYVVTSDGVPATAGPFYGRDNMLTQRAASTIIVIDPASGSLFWQKKLSYDLSDPVLESGTIYGIGSTTMHGTLYALSGSDGSVIWQQPFAQTTGFYISMVAVSRTLYFEKLADPSVGNEFSFYAFSSKDGSELWKTSQFLSKAGGSQLTVSGNIIYACVNEVLYAFKSDDGSILWSRTFPVVDNGVIPVANGLIYLQTQAAFNQQPITLQALNASTGKTVWSEQAPEGTGPWLVNHNNLYILGAGSLFVFDPMTGKSITSYPFPTDQDGLLMIASA